MMLLAESVGGTENSPIRVLNLASISGVLAASMMAVQLIKRLIPAGSVFARVPIFVYTILVAAGLALLANKVLTTSDGSPLLEGDIWKVMWSAIGAAAGASGFFTWLYNPETIKDVKLDPTNNDFGGKLTEKDQESLTPPKAIFLLPLLMLPMLTGCLPKEAPPAYQLYNANKTLTESNNLVADLINQKVIKSKPIAEGYRELAQQTASAIDKAEKLIQPDGSLPIGQAYWYNQALELVNRVVAFRLKYKTLSEERSELCPWNLLSPLHSPSSNDLPLWPTSRLA